MIAVKVGGSDGVSPSKAYPLGVRFRVKGIAGKEGYRSVLKTISTPQDSWASPNKRT